MMLGAIPNIIDSKLSLTLKGPKTCQYILGSKVMF